ncbi:uncharacterized protein BDV17DRAFT_256882 [Aspergillus undulatus]|uniref:uncharacterized protein n=1 Tax=Aspergillus undulatus TaxID=1810928 RepID=UPI003CCE4BE3
MLMAAGRSAPRYQLMGAIYPKSELLQSYMQEYFIFLVTLCQHVVRLSQKSVLKKLTSSLTDPPDSYQAGNPGVCLGHSNEFPKERVYSFMDCRFFRP